MSACAFVSDGIPGMGDHHSRDMHTVWFGSREPVRVCGYHSSRPDVMARVYEQARSKPSGVVLAGLQVKG